MIRAGIKIPRRRGTAFVLAAVACAASVGFVAPASAADSGHAAGSKRGGTNDVYYRCQHDWITEGTTVGGGNDCDGPANPGQYVILQATDWSPELVCDEMTITGTPYHYYLKSNHCHETRAA